jgi:hypothetical protein
MCRGGERGAEKKKMKGKMPVQLRYCASVVPPLDDRVTVVFSVLQTTRIACGMPQQGMSSRAPFVGHTEGVLSVAFSPDG